MKKNLMAVVLDRIEIKSGNAENSLSHENHPPFDNSDDHVP